MDCEVLMDGYCVFRDWVLEHTELDVDSYTTTQSLASSFMLKSGCYEECVSNQWCFTTTYFTMCGWGEGYD